MNKIVLIDGNNLLYRSYFATAYNGNFMKNSKGFPTNGLFGFNNMINKIILEEKPVYIMVAFDKGKTFRHDKYENYKGGREETPEELKIQFPKAKELLTYMGIKYYETDNYEADDIIGTFAEYCNNDDDYQGLIVSSDKDLLQLISRDVEIKLLKSKDYIRYDLNSFIKEYNMTPDKIVDLKALMGDSSDNIPGVKGIGEKTALKLLQDYKSLDGVYENINKLTPKLQEKLIADKDNAYMSYDLATIYKKVPLEINLEDIKYNKKDNEKLNKLYEELEFYSFLRKEEKELPKKTEEYKIITDIKDVNITSISSIYLEILGTNYHNSKILGVAIYNEHESIYIPFDILKQNLNVLNNNIKYTYDLKKLYVALKWHNIEINSITFDTMIAAYLLDYNIKDDISYLANTFEYDIPFYDDTYKLLKTKEIYEEKDLQVTAYSCILKAKFIYETQKMFEQKLQDQKLDKLFYEIEMPLAKVLGNMELNGINLDINEINKRGIEIKERFEIIENEIFELTDEKFNISSPKQLGEILFEKLNLKHGKKTKSGYSTSIDVLEKIRFEHPVIDKIIEYRMLTKLYTTYVEGLKNMIMSDNKIHTIYTQTLTRTGRLSSIEPNLQNIPIRYEYGRLLRKAFIPSPDSVILSGDYSQIELRILSHMANVTSLIEAFKQGIDIHTKTASDIFKVKIEEVNSSMRRIAKAVNFGIIYGISSFGLSENIGVSPNEAKEFIDRYLESYPGIKEYMDDVIKEAYKNGYVTTLMNRKRVIPELSNKNRFIRSSGERIALNTPIQGTSADIIKKAMIDIDKEFTNQNIKSKMILQVHDELIFDCLKQEKDKVIEIVTNCMENVLDLNVPLKVDMNWGDNWYQAK
ncbi:MAG: DNA polymerase I [Bacilli bacterium]|nr:DNA polymerase I [Bacilli bacterium]